MKAKTHIWLWPLVLLLVILAAPFLFMIGWILCGAIYLAAQEIYLRRPFVYKHFADELAVYGSLVDKRISTRDISSGLWLPDQLRRIGATGCFLEPDRVHFSLGSGFRPLFFYVVRDEDESTDDEAVWHYYVGSDRGRDNLYTFTVNLNDENVVESAIHKAIERFDRAQQKEPENANLASAKIRFLYFFNQTEQALITCQEAIQAFPNEAHIHLLNVTVHGYFVNFG